MTTTSSIGSGAAARAAFRLGALEVAPALVLAPMAGLTDVTFRRAVRRCGGVGLVVSEILPSEALVRGALRSEDHMAIGPDEHPVALQLSGSDPDHMAEAARRCVDEGADVVDLNMGCPVRKITKSLCGVALLRDPRRAARVAGAVVRAVPVPVTVKMRLGWSERELTFVEVARALEQEGVAGLALHGRTREQGYAGRSDWSRVAELKAAVSIPVVGNGDVTRPEEALALWAETGCDGVMVGRAAVRNPWIFRQIEDLRTTGAYREPSAADRAALLTAHFEELLQLGSGSLALYRMKNFIGTYTKGLPGAEALRTGLSRHETPATLLDAVRAWALGAAPSPA